MKIEEEIHFGKLFLQFPLLRKTLAKKNLKLSDLCKMLNLSSLSRKQLRLGYSIKKKRDKNKIKYFIKNNN